MDTEAFRKRKEIFDDGFMKGRTDLAGLGKHLADIGILKTGDSLETMN